MVSNNICDLAKLRAGALAMFQNGELDGVLSKEDRALLGTDEAQPSKTTTKGGETTTKGGNNPKGKGKAKEAQAVDPKVAQLRSDYEALNAINHERDLQYRELQAENRRLTKALQDKKAKQTAEAKLAYEKRKAERTPEQQAKIDAQTQKMLDGAKKAREAKKALAGTAEPKETASSGKPAKPLSLKELVERARAKKEAPKNVPIPKEKITYGVNKEALKAKEQRAKIDAEIKRKQDLKDATESKYKGDALKGKLKELQGDTVALENAKKAIEDGVDPKTPEELLGRLLVKSQQERSKAETWEIAKGIADYNREIKNAPKKEQVQARKDLLATTDAQYKGDALQAKLKEIKANEEVMANAKKQIEANQDPTTPEELLAHNLVKQAKNKSKIKPKITDLSKGFSEFATNERLAPAREAKALFDTKQQALRDEINKTFEAPDGTVHEASLQEHIQTLRDDDLLLAEARDEVANKIAPYSIDSYLAHEIVKKLDAEPKGKKPIDPTVEAVRKALNKTKDPDVLRKKEQRKLDIENFEAEIAEKYDTVDKLKKAVQAVKDNPDLLEETRQLIADGGFPTTVEQYIAMHQLKRGAKEMPKKPSDLSKALTSVNRNVEPKEPPAPFSWLSDALSSKENLSKATKALDGKKTKPSLRQKLGIKSKFKTPIEIQQAKEKAYRKILDNYLIEKVPNATPRMRKSAVNRLMELYADGRTLTPEQVKTVLKQELVPSGITASFQNKLKELQAKLDAVDDSDARADVKYDEKLLLKAQINAELSSLIKPNMGDKFNANLFIEPLLNVGSAVGDVLGSLNAVANHMLVDKLTRVVMGAGSKVIKTLGKKGGLSKADYGDLTKEQIAKLKEFDNSFTTNFKYAMKNFNFKHFIDGKARNEAQQAKKLWKPLQYTLDGHVAIGHDEVFSDKLRPKFAYENKGFKGASFIDKAETVGHHLELLGNFRLNATDIPILDFVYRNNIGQTIIDGLKEDPNFKLTEEHVKNAHAFTNSLLFKSDNFVTQNIKHLRDWADFKLDVGGNKVTIPIGSIIHRYTRTPVNYTLRSLDVTGLADLRFLFGYAGKGLNKNKDKWVKQAREKFNDDIANKLDTGIDVFSKLLNAGITKYELKKGKKGGYYPEAILDEKTNKPVLISDKQHDFAMVQGIVKMALSGTLGTGIFMLGKNTDIFSTGYVKETSDTEEAEGTRNDFYFNGSATLRAMTGGNGRNEKGDWMFPLSRILGQHTFGAQTTVKLAKQGEVTGEEANLIADFFNASQNQFGEGVGLFNWADFTKKPVETVIERLPKIPFLGAIGRDAVNVFDDTEKVTKGKDTIDTSINRYFNGSVFKALGSPKIDVTGEKVHAGGLGKALGFPFKIAKADPVIKELRKVSREAGVDVQLTQVDRRFEIGKTLAKDYGTTPQFLKLNAKDFSKWQEIHNNIVYKAVSDVLESEDYKSLTDPLDRADEIQKAKENPSVQIGDKDYTPKELFLEYKLKGRVVNINR